MSAITLRFHILLYDNTDRFCLVHGDMGASCTCYGEYLFCSVSLCLQLGTYRHGHLLYIDDVFISCSVCVSPSDI